jgi:hypothetical protein
MKRINDTKEIENKKLEKDCLFGFAVGTDSTYSILKFKISLKEMVTKYPNGLDFLQKEYNKTKASLSEGKAILNKNLEELGIIL